MGNRFAICATVAMSASMLMVRSLEAQQSAATVADFRAIASRITTESKVFPLVRDGGDQSAQTSPEPLLSFFASNDGVVAKARFGYLVSDVIALDAVVSGPVRGGGANFASKTGLGNGVTFDGEMTLVLSRKTSGQTLPSTPLPSADQGRTPPSSSPQQLLAPFGAIPREQGLQRLGLGNVQGTAVSLDDLVAASLRLAAGIQGTGGAALVRHSGAGPMQAILSSPGVTAAAQMSPETLAPMLDSPLGREAFATAFRYLSNDLNLWQVERAWLLTLKATEGRPTFTVADTSALKFQQVTKNAHGKSVAVGTVITRKKQNASQGFYFGGSWETSTDFGASPKSTCLPSGTAGALVCQNAVLVEPSGQTSRTLQGDARFYFNNLSIAISARPSYEKESRETTIAFPVYFLQNSKDLQSAITGDKAGLTGGVNVGWKKSPGNRADFFALFFVGSLFKLPGVPH